MSFITDQEAERAMNFLATSARKIGQARENLVKAEAFAKRVEAIEFLKAEGPIEQRKAIARASDAVLEASGDEARAAGEWEEMRALREAAAAKMDAWRSLTASARAASK